MSFAAWPYLDPVDVRPLLSEVHDALIALMDALSPEEWCRPTACERWSVKDVALHLLGGDISLLSRERDGDDSGLLPPGPTLAARLNLLNERWVEASRGMSTRLLVDLLRTTGPQTISLLRGRDPDQKGNVVSWAGPDPAPAWLDTAREYTERWHHQQHIRDAVHRPGLTAPRYLHPVLATFVRALPLAFHEAHAPIGTAVRFSATGPAGGSWVVIQGESGWSLLRDSSEPVAATVEVDQDSAWRLLTKGLSPAEARAEAAISGDQRLAEIVLGALAIIA